jgi:hypothetical protein
MHANETPLERLLRNSDGAPGLRPEFYKRLMDAQVLVPVKVGPGQSIDGVIPADTELGVITLRMDDGTEVVPFYTSAARVYEGSPEGEQCVLMSTWELFELFQHRPEMHFHLNPFSKFGRYFTPPEAAALLARGMPQASDRQRVKIDDNVTPSEPTQLPVEILDALAVCFARNLQVKAAYIAELRWPAGHTEPRLLIAADLVDGGDRDQLHREVGTVLIEMEKADQPTVAFGVLRRDGSRISNYFLQEAKPFYEAALSARLLQR